MKLLVVFAALLAAASAQSYQAPEVRSAPTSYQAPETRAALRPVARILEQSNENNGPAGFAFRFSSDDGIAREESGDASAVTGQYTYTSPEGVEILVRYIADSQGFRAEGEALPTPVPTEYPTPEVPSTEAPQVRTVQSYSAPEPQPAEVRQVQYEPVYAYRPRYQ